MTSIACQLFWFPAVKQHEQHLQKVCGTAIPTKLLQIALMPPSFTNFNTSPLKTEFLDIILLVFDISKEKYQTEQAYHTGCLAIVKKMRRALKTILPYVHISHKEWEKKDIKYVTPVLVCVDCCAGHG